MNKKLYDEIVEAVKDKLSIYTERKYPALIIMSDKLFTQFVESKYCDDRGVDGVLYLDGTPVYVDIYMEDDYVVKLGLEN